MRKFLTIALAAVTMVGGMATTASAVPFQGSRAAVAQGAAEANPFEQVQRRVDRNRRHYRGNRHYRGGRDYRGARYYRGGRNYDRRYYRRDRNNAVAAGVAGLAAGAIIGGALSANQAPRSSVAYCQQRFRSYDVRTGTYMGYDGIRRACP